MNNRPIPANRRANLDKARGSIRRFILTMNEMAGHLTREQKLICRNAEASRDYWKNWKNPYLKKNRNG